jgi:hypothetical protein
MDTNELERQARRRANAQFGWLIHAGVYAAVNTGLILLAWSQGRSWAVFPALGWGLGLAIHGVVVFALRSSLQQRLLERERRRLGLDQRS